MAKLELTQKERVFIRAHVNTRPLTTTLERRRADKLWDAIKLDDLPDSATVESLGKDIAEYEGTSDDRDLLIEWLTPTDRFTQTTQLARVVGPALDRLTKARDGG